MADFRINVIVDPSQAEAGARRIDSALERIERRAQRTQRLLRRLTVGPGGAAQQAQRAEQRVVQNQARLREQAARQAQRAEQRVIANQARFRQQAARQAQRNEQRLIQEQARFRQQAAQRAAQQTQRAEERVVANQARFRQQAVRQAQQAARAAERADQQAAANQARLRQQAARAAMQAQERVIANQARLRQQAARDAQRAEQRVIANQARLRMQAARAAQRAEQRTIANQARLRTQAARAAQRAFERAQRGAGRTAQQTDRVERSLRRVNRTATSSERILRRVFAIGGGTILIRQLVTLVDTYTNITNRLRFVAGGNRELVRSQTELFAIANRTRTAFETTAQVYARTALSADALGASQQELLRFTESVNQAVILSGAGFVEANAALIQLSQGIASNTLRGDELRSVLEQLPVVADVIARSLGATRGQLRALAAEGRLTAEVILRAFREAREELAGDFARTVPTLGQSFNVFRNNLVQFIGETDRAAGISALLSRSLIALSMNLGTASQVAVILLATIAYRRWVRSAAGARLLGTNIARLQVRLRQAARAGGALRQALIFTAIIEGIDFTVGHLRRLSREARTTAQQITEVLDRVERGTPTRVRTARGTREGPLRALNPEEIRQAAQEVEDILANLAESGRIPDTPLLDRIQNLLPQITDDYRRLIEVQSLLTQAQQGRRNVLQVSDTGISTEPIERAINSLLQRARTAGQTFSRDFIDALREQFPGLSEELLRALTAVSPQQANQAAQDFLEDLQREIALFNNESNAAAAQYEITSGRFRQASDEQQQAILAAARELDRLTASDTISTYLRDLEREAELLGLTNREREIRTALLQLEDQVARPLRDSERASAAFAAAGAFDARQGQREEDRFRAIEELQEENRLLQLNGAQREVQQALFRAEQQLRQALRDETAQLSEAQRQEIEGLVRSNRALERQQQVYQQLRDPVQTYVEGLADINAVLERHPELTDRAAQAQQNLRLQYLDTQMTFQAGVERGLIRLEQDLNDFSVNAERAVTGTFRGIEDAIVDVATRGRLEIGDLVNSILGDLARLAVRETITRPLFEAFQDLTGLGQQQPGAGPGGGAGATQSALATAQTTATPAMSSLATAQTTATPAMNALASALTSAAPTMGSAASRMTAAGATQSAAASGMGAAGVTQATAGTTQATAGVTQATAGASMVAAASAMVAAGSAMITAAGIISSAGVGIGAAGGGRVSGPGSGTSDSIPARLSDGEYVINAAATRRYGSLLDQINAQRFQEGGPVRRSSAPPRATNRQAQRGGGDVEVNVYNQGSRNDDEVQVQQRQGPSGRRIIDIILLDSMSQAIHNGELDGPMEGRYGVRPSISGRT